MEEKIKNYISTNSTDEFTFSENHQKWMCTYFIQKTKRYYFFKIVAIQPFWSEPFGENRISKNRLISLFAKYNNYNLTGQSNMHTDFLFSNSTALDLLSIRKSQLELDEWILTYKCCLKRKQASHLFTVLEQHKHLLTEITDSTLLRAK